MQIFRQTHDLKQEFTGAAVALGNFDGLHGGHRAILHAAGTQAARHNIPLGVLSFEPHPRSVFQPDITPFRLTPFRTKSRLLEAFGVDVFYCLHFDRDFSQISANNFVEQILIREMKVAQLVVGTDFVFGQGRGGNVDLLRHYEQQGAFGLTVLSPVQNDAGMVYSSTAVRAALQAGDPQQAEALLGRPFEIEGRVERGAQRGRKLSYPTANMALHDYQHPKYGIYAVKVGVNPSGAIVWHNGVANLGVRPMFDGGHVLLEAHIFNFVGDLYGQHLRVALIEYLRDEQKFADITDLMKQMDEDSAKARHILKKYQFDEHGL